MAVVTFSNIKGGGGGGGTLTGITFLNSDYTLDFIESAVTEAVDSAVPEAVESAMTAYTPTSGFATINGSAITEGGDIVIETGGNYSAGTNIDITDNVISVTGITVPTSNTAFTNDAGYITSGALSAYSTTQEMNTAIDNAVSGKMDSSGMSAYTTDTDVENMISAATAATTGWVSEQGYITSGSLTGYSTTQEMNTAIDNATSGKVDTSALTEYYTSAQTESAITSKGYITGYTETDPVFGASAASGITSQDITNWDGKLDSSALSAYTPTSGFSTINGSAITNGDNLVIEGTPYSGGTGIDITDHIVSVTGDYETVVELTQAQYDALTAYTENTTYIITDAPSINMSAYTPTSGFSTINGSAITTGDAIVIDVPTSNTAFTNDAGYITSGQAQTQIDNSISGKADASYVEDFEEVTSIALNDLNDNKQDTLVSGTNIKTINNESLLGSGNIVISGGSGSANIIELTQAEYDALTAYTEDAMYVITDATAINMDNYATTGSLESFYTSAQTDTAISNAVSGKTDKVSVTANTGRQFPRWNSQGVVTGTTGNTVYERNFSVNGTSKTMLQTTNSDLPSIYAPTSAGTAGQPLLSNGSGAPVWASYKFAFITQTQYDALTPDSTTIYFIIGD